MRRPVAVAAAILLLAAGCKGLKQRQPEENPITADLVNYRNGLALLRDGKADEAIQLLRAARASYPEDPAVANALGLALLYKKDYPAALKAFSESMKLDPNLVEARNNRGVAYLEMGKLDEAEADFAAILSTSSGRDKLNARFNQGLLDVKRQRWVEAENQFSAVLSEDPKYVRARRERGIVRVQREKFGEALEDLLQFLKGDPQDAAANYNAALALLTTGRRDIARRYMQRTVAAAPESDEAKKARRFLDEEPSAASPARER